MDLIEWMYTMYLTLSVILMVWVAQTLHRNGRIFLVDSFQGNEALADSVNHLLVVGFYLINIGYVCFALKYTGDLFSLREVMEGLSLKMGWVLLILGGMHFFNLWVLNGMRKRGLRAYQPPPIPPDARVIVTA
jgi:hypothetical protein